MKTAGGVSWPEEAQFLKPGQSHFQTSPEAARARKAHLARSFQTIKGHLLMLPQTHLCRRSRRHTGSQDFAPVPPPTHPMTQVLPPSCWMTRQGPQCPQHPQSSIGSWARCQSGTVSPQSSGSPRAVHYPPYTPTRQQGNRSFSPQFPGASQTAEPNCFDPGLVLKGSRTWLI